MRRSFILASAFSILAGTAFAETLTCKQTKLSSSGFTSISAAKSWFPENTQFRINGSEVISDFYGKGKVDEKDGRQYFSFVMATSGGDKITLDVTHIKRNGRYSARLRTKSRYNQTPGATGKCKAS